MRGPVASFGDVVGCAVYRRTQKRTTMKTAFTSAVLIVIFSTGVCYGNSVVDNGTFDSDLSGWTVVGSSAAQQGGRAVLSEDPANTNVSIEQSLVIPQGYVALRFDYWTHSDPDVGPTGTGTTDIFVAFLLDAANVPILADPAGGGEFFYHENTANGAQYPSWVSVSGNTVTLNISSVTGSGDLEATLAFGLGSFDNGTDFEVEIDNVQAFIPEPVTALAAGMALAGIANYLRRRRLPV